MCFQLLTVLKQPLWRSLLSTVDSISDGCWMLTENKTTNWTTASSTAVCLTFYSETRHVSVTCRKLCWLTRLILCPWRHYESALPGYWYLWSNTKSDVRNSQIQTDSMGERLPSYSWESFFFLPWNSNLGQSKVHALQAQWQHLSEVNCFGFFVFFPMLGVIQIFHSKMYFKTSWLANVMWKSNQCFKYCSPCQIRWLTALKWNTLNNPA